MHTVAPVHRGGTPISQLSGGKHPPRTFLDHVPGGDSKAAHIVIDELYAVLSGEEKGELLGDIRDWLARENPVFDAIRSASQTLTGFRLPIQTRGSVDLSPALSSRAILRAGGA